MTAEKIVIVDRFFKFARWTNDFLFLINYIVTIVCLTDGIVKY
jgi:hypothetical protein